MGNKNLLLVFLLVSIFFFFFLSISFSFPIVTNQQQGGENKFGFRFSLAFFSFLFSPVPARLAAGWGVCDVTPAC